MIYEVSQGFDGEGDATLYVSVLGDGGGHLRYLGEDELEGMRDAIADLLNEKFPLMDICACGGKLDSWQQCERGDECPEQDDDEHGGELTQADFDEESNR